MGERTLLKLRQGSDKIYLYLHWYTVKECEEAVLETSKNQRNNIKELAKFVVYFIQDHEKNASIYMVPRNQSSYGEDYTCEIDIDNIKGE